jgi:outer membrane protein OmpA-like peptidoglycan-associated protein
MTDRLHRYTHTAFRALLVLTILALALPFRVNAEELVEAIPIRLKYLFGFNGEMSGTPLQWVDKILVDDTHNEVYLLDTNNRRIVVTDTSGMYIAQFRYENAGIKMPLDLAVDPETGEIYVAEPNRIAVLNYRGDFQRNVNISALPGDSKGHYFIQSIYLDKKNGLLYIGSTGAVSVITLDGKLVRSLSKKDGIDSNVKSLKLNDGEIIFIDASTFSVYRFNEEGKRDLKFGKVSSLLGGFSMISDLAVDVKRDRIIVLDTNRMMVVVFDWNGNAIYEFGGPNVFLWPRAVAIDGEGHYYVADNTGVIRVFEVVEDPIVRAPQEPAPAEPVPSEEANPDESAKEPAPPVAPGNGDKEDAGGEDVSEVADSVDREARLLPVYFEFDSAALTQSAKDTLEKNAKWLVKNPDINIYIRGYADIRGTDEYNVELSRKRAEAVMVYFGKHGIEPERMKAEPRGKDMGAGVSEAEMTKSRRVDFFVE